MAMPLLPGPEYGPLHPALEELVQELIADPNDPRTRPEEFLNGYTTLEPMESELAELELLKEECRTRTCDPARNGHLPDCWSKSIHVQEF